ncbi:MAG: arylsulfatase [Verrucomicrobiota bacterium]
MRSLLPLLLCVLALAADRKPNLIYILADDLGYGDLGSYGQKLIRTPELDRMAKEGMRFTQFYAGATVCAPSRSVLMTGLQQGHTRVRGNSGIKNPGAQALREGDLTVAKFLQSAGYRTALIGKWGLGDVAVAESGLPRKQGFDEFYGFLNQHHAHNHFPDYLWRNETREPLPNVVTPLGDHGGGYATKKEKFADDLFAEESLRFVERIRDRPFFLFWSMVIPHANNERTAAFKDGADAPDFGPYAEASWPDPDKGQAALVTLLDSYVGRMLRKLRELGIDKDTLVVFSSDNGPHREAGQDPERFDPNGPYTGYKRDLTDGGIRVPFIAWWPGRVRPGTETGHVSYAGDFFATAAEAAGLPAPAGLDSISFVPTLLGKDGQKKHEFLYWEFHERGFQQAALLDGRWKGIRTGGPDRTIRLHDLSVDVAEQKDLAAEHPEVARRIGDHLKTARTDAEDWKPAWQAADGRKKQTTKKK